MKRKELKEKRTPNMKVFENQDHSCTAEIYLDAVHYEENGMWKDMDDRLFEETDEKSYVNKKGKLKIHFKKHAKERETATITKENCSLTWGVESADKVSVQKKEENAVVYPNILEHVDIRYRVSGEGVKEDILLMNPQASATVQFLYQMKGVSPVLQDNCVRFMNEQDEEVFVLSAPYMKDSQGQISEKITVSLELEKKNYCKISIHADEDWLKSEERTYPVVIDPVITTSKKSSEIYDAHVDSLNEEDNFFNSIILKTMGGDNIQRSFLKFTLPGLKSGDMVVKARLVLVSLAQDGKKRTVQVHKVLQDWESDTITWNNKPAYSETVEDLCTFTGDEQKYVTLDVTRMVKDWYQNGNNYGLMFKDDHELSGYTEFLSSDCDNDYQNMRPRIEISYVNYSGLENYWSYHSQNIGRAGNVHVNDYNGNLILEHPTIATGGSRMPVNLVHTYNTNDRTVNLGYGYGYRLNYHQTLKKVTISDVEYYKHTEGDGTVHYFYYDNEKKKWKDESGLERELTINTESAEPYIIKDKEDNCMVFDKAGYLVKVRDKNNNVIAITYSNNRITAITDGAGRKLILSYQKDSDGNLTYLEKVKAPSGEIKFYYTNGNLTSIEDKDGEVMSYTYTSRRNLSSVKNIDGYQVKYSYYTTVPNRVKKITEYGGTKVGDSLTLVYGYNSTKFTDAKGRSEIYRFNNQGNLLHVHDGFGHAASAKYNRSGNHVNRLENSTKLQNNVVQLLKDPIVQAKKCGWTSKVSDTAGEGTTASINTNASYCKVGNRSLKLSTDSVKGYAYWAQYANLEKGKTYTFSMHVRASVSEIADDGKCVLRVMYYDKDGNSVNQDSSPVRRSSDGFILMKNTFTLPADAQNERVKLYFFVLHMKGTVYGDMAQLEPGTTVSRCNLVDSGDFHTGTLSGFSKTGRAEDYLVTVGKNVYIPAQRGLIIRASSAIVYSTPEATGTQVTTLSKGAHVSGACIVSDSAGTRWYRVKTTDGKWGYIEDVKAAPYVAGGNGTDAGIVAVSGAVLRSAASDTATPVEEWIPKGACLAIVSSTTDANDKKWYRVGLNIDKKRYYGYLPTDVVIRSLWSSQILTMREADQYRLTPSQSGTSAGSVKKGDTVCARGILEKSNGEMWYAVLKGKNFVFLYQVNAEPVNEGYWNRLYKDAVPEGVGGLENHIMRFVGSHSEDKKLTKTLDIQGKKGDVYMVNAWGRGKSLPETDNDKKRRFGVEVIFVADDGTTDVHYSNFSPDILDWQFLSEIYAAKQDYTSIKVSFTYCHNANEAFFDGLALFREEFGRTYTYDDDNNLISVTDAQKNATKFEYNSSSDMTGIQDAKGYKFTYEYDKKHNVTKGTSAQGLVYKLAYDSAGNITKSGCVEPDTPEKGIWISRTFTSNKNHVSSVTDARNNTIHYNWNEKDLLESVNDAKGNQIVYGYDNAERLTSVSQKVIHDGVEQEIINTYTYNKDRMTSIEHNGFCYGFDYDAFGNTVSASVAGTKVIDYEYEPGNGNLKKITYGNGDYIRYIYDSMDRISLSYYYSKAQGIEQKMDEYTYDKQGNLCEITAHMAGKTYHMSYDFLDRLVYVRDEKGYYYQYTYDEKNQVTKMFHWAGNTLTTTYKYDKDGRETECKVATNLVRTTEYDKLGRINKQYWSTEKSAECIYEYDDSADGINCNGLVKTIRNGELLTSYNYDENGNIIRMERRNGSQEDAVVTDTYEYDELNQLVRENSQTQNKTIVYRYDLGGNLLEMKEYAYTTESVVLDTPVKTETGIYDSVWRDKLLQWNGENMTYDAIGNMLSRGTTTYTWTQGRKLSGVENGKSIKYFYDHTGARTKKIVDGVTTEYRMAGELLVSEKEDTGKTVWYKYDSNARLISMITGGKTYIYVRNVQNDIVGLLNSNGDMVVEYVYDSWGNVLSITGSEKDTVGQINPFRYRGYYYDSETGMYYLKERYYDPKLRRFISADNYIIGSNEILANLYTYCANNPVNNYDPSGQLLKKILNWAKRKINKAIQTIHTASKRFVRNTFSVKPSLITRRDYSTPTKVIRLTYSSSSGIPVSTSNSQSGYLYCNIINGGKDIDVGSRRNVGSMFIDSSISLMEKSISITSGVGNVSSGVQYDRDDNTIGWFVSKSSTYKNVDFEGTVGIEIDFDELMDLAKEVAIATAVVATGIAVGAAAGAGIVYLANSVAASGTLMVVALAFAG